MLRPLSECLFGVREFNGVLFFHLLLLCLVALVNLVCDCFCSIFYQLLIVFCYCCECSSCPADKAGEVLELVKFYGLAACVPIFFMYGSKSFIYEAQTP